MARKYRPQTGERISQDESLDADLLTACALGDEASILEALKAGASREACLKRTGHCAFVVAMSIRSAARKSIEALLTSCAPNLPSDGAGTTPLMHAAHLGLADSVQELLPGSDADAVDKNGMTALMHAALRGELECARLLLPLSDMGVKNRRGQGAAELAREYGHQAMAAEIEREHSRREAVAISEVVGASKSSPIKGKTGRGVSL